MKKYELIMTREVVYITDYEQKDGFVVLGIVLKEEEE